MMIHSVVVSISTKTVSVTYTIPFELAQRFKNEKGYFKKSTLISYWILQYLENKKEFVPIRNNPSKLSVEEKTPTQKGVKS